MVDPHGGAHRDLSKFTVLLDLFLHDAELCPSARQFLPCEDSLPVILRCLAIISLLIGFDLTLAL